MEEGTKERSNALCETPCRALPFGEVLRNVRRQICLTDEYRGLYKNAELALDIAKIITEVYMMHDEAELLISGEKIGGYLVKEVFREIKPEHVENVIDYYCHATHKIAVKRHYLRSALYNSVFEAEAAVVNEYNVYAGGGK